MKILIDNGHGIDTKGKRSPDGRLLEYAQNRLLAGRNVSALLAWGLDASLLVPEEKDISLPERCRRVNECCRQLGKDKILLISIHCNAAGRGNCWLSARGWCAYTTRGNTRADALATSLYTAAQAHHPGHSLRTDYTDGDPDWEENFYILRTPTVPPSPSKTFGNDLHVYTNNLVKRRSPARNTLDFLKESHSIQKKWANLHDLPICSVSLLANVPIMMRR